MSELLKQIEEANETNRNNVHFAMAEFAHKLTQEANGIPMKRTRHQNRYVVRKDGKAEIVENVG
jgi:hypothetical protein